MRPPSIFKSRAQPPRNRILNTNCIVKQAIIFCVDCHLFGHRRTAARLHRSGAEEMMNSASFLAEIPVRSPQKIFIFIVKKNYFLDLSIQINILFNFEKGSTDDEAHLSIHKRRGYTERCSHSSDRNALVRLQEL